MNPKIPKRTDGIPVLVGRQSWDLLYNIMLLNSASCGSSKYVFLAAYDKDFC